MNALPIDVSKYVPSINSQTLAIKNELTSVDNENTFDMMYKALINLYNQTNELQIEKEQLQLDYAAGKTDDMVSVMLAQEKAYTGLSFTVQVTSKIIEAYREIMRMQL